MRLQFRLAKLENSFNIIIDIYVNLKKYDIAGYKRIFKIALMIQFTIN